MNLSQIRQQLQDEYDENGIPFLVLLIEPAIVIILPLLTIFTIYRTTTYGVGPMVGVVIFLGVFFALWVTAIGEAFEDYFDL